MNMASRLRTSHIHMMMSGLRRWHICLTASSIG